MRRKLVFAAAAFAMPLLVLGLPLVAALCIGADRADAVAAWLNRHSGHGRSPTVGTRLPPFALVDQSGAPVTSDSLKGHVFVASFFLSRCAGTCPMTSAKMAKLQQAITDPRVKLVSFSMDPERDTPAVLAEYAKKFDADAARWHMLTGDREQVVRVVDGLGLAIVSGQRPTDMIHSDRFVLVDADGAARGFYDSGQDGDMTRLASHAAALARLAPPSAQAP
jgi:protein SCO1/2